MKKIILMLLMVASVTVSGQSKVDYLHESESATAQRLKWFKDAKFGLFIHFGLYSQLGGEWNGKTVKGYAEWLQSSADIPSQVYAVQLAKFNPTNFDADLIVKTAKDAGMKYVVITTKHHEGFCLWDSKYTDFDVASTPFKGRDILKEMSVACKKYGLVFGTYYSIIDWHHPSQERNIDGTDAWGHWAEIRMKLNQTKVYVQYMKNQIKELIDNYDTDILWFDGDWVYWWDLETGEDLYQYIRSLKPSIIINNRVAVRQKFKKDFGTPEQFHPNEPLPYPWEACYTMNDSWGFKKGDTNWKSAKVISEKLKDINNKGGNLLLNVGPDGTGRVPEKSLEILRELGKMNHKK